VRDAEGIRGHLDAGRAHDVVIVGSGLIAVETTEALVSRGCCVTIVEMQQQILDADMARLLGEAHGGTRRAHAHGDGDRGFVGKGRVEGVQTYTHGVIPANLVILGVGVQAESSLARVASGNRADHRHRLDQRMQTSDRDICAAGDCVECVDLLTGRRCYAPS